MLKVHVLNDALSHPTTIRYAGSYNSWTVSSISHRQVIGSSATPEMMLVRWTHYRLVHNLLPGSASPLSGCRCGRRRQNRENTSFCKLVTRSPFQNSYGTVRARIAGERTCSIRTTTCVSWYSATRPTRPRKRCRRSGNTNQHSSPRRGT